MPVKVSAGFARMQSAKYQRNRASFAKKFVPRTVPTTVTVRRMIRRQTSSNDYANSITSGQLLANNDTNATGNIFQLLSGISVGDAQGNRTGAHIGVTKLVMNYWLTGGTPSQTTPNPKVRCILFQDRIGLGVVPTPAMLYGATPADSNTAQQAPIPFIENKKRFKILFDKKYTLATPGVEVVATPTYTMAETKVINYRKTWKQPLDVSWNSNISTTIPYYNGLFLMVLPQSTNLQLINMYCRIFYNN